MMMKRWEDSFQFQDYTISFQVDTAAHVKMPMWFINVAFVQIKIIYWGLAEAQSMTPKQATLARKKKAPFKRKKP